MDCEWDFPAVGTVRHMRQAVLDVCRSWKAAFPDGRVEVLRRPQPRRSAHADAPLNSTHYRRRNEQHGSSPTVPSTETAPFLATPSPIALADMMSSVTSASLFSRRAVTSCAAR